MKKENKKVSIVVPVFNSEKYLSRCIDSIIEQTYKNIEVLLIDDGSTDKSLMICKQYAEKDKRIKVLSHENYGVSYTRNRGIENSTGDYLFFIDSDDYIDNLCISKMVLATKKNSVIALSYKKIFNDNKIKIITPPSITTESFVNLILEGKIDGYCWGYLIDKQYLGNIRFNENTSYLEDMLFIIQYILKFKKIVTIDSAYYNYIDNELGISNPKSNLYKKITDIMYSLNLLQFELKNIMDNPKLEHQINQKKILLLDYLTQNIAKNDLIKIMNNEEIIVLCKKGMKDKQLKLRYRIFLFLIVKKEKKLFNLYKYLRKIGKCLKRTLVLK